MNVGVGCGGVIDYGAMQVMGVVVMVVVDRQALGVLAEQLDARHRPCNFVPHLKQAAACDSRG